MPLLLEYWKITPSFLLFGAPQDSVAGIEPTLR